jgi:hypothetical protein
MPRIPDSTLTAPTFKKHLKNIDRYAEEHHLDKWAARIAWIGLVYNVLVARRFAQRRPHHQTSQAWTAYTNLLKAGVFSEEPEGIVYEETPQYETDEGVALWLNTLIHIAEGLPVPTGFPCHGYQDEKAPQLQVFRGGK